MNYWRDLGEAAEQGAVNEIQISFSTIKSSIFSYSHDRFFLSFSKKPERTSVKYDLNHCYHH